MTDEEETMDPLLLTVRQACAKLSISRSRFYELRAAGHIRTVTVGGPHTVRVHVRDIEAYAERLRDAGAA